MADNFTIDQFDWLRRVASDAGLSPAASRVAIALTKYFSRERDGWAWMSQATLAHDLGMPVRTVGRALASLIERGHLVTRRRGKMETNLYHLALKNSDGDRPPMATHTGVIGQNLQSDRPKPVKVIGHPWPTNPLNEPLEEPIEESPSKREGASKSSGRRRSSTPPPESISVEMTDYAVLKGWNSSRAAGDFEKFRDYHLAKGNTYSDWQAAWRTWVRNGIAYDHRQQQGETIDQNGNKVAPPPNRGQRQPPPRRQTNTDV